MQKTIEVENGLEKEFEKYLQKNEIKNNHFVFTSGSIFWHIFLDNKEQLEKIEKLTFVKQVKDTMFYYPS